MLFEDRIMVYDLTQLDQENNVDISNQKKKIEPIESWQDVNRTYDRILGQWINKNDLYKSWIIL